MIESGVIVKTNKDIATVKVDKKDECSKCGMCLFPKNANSIELTAINNMGAQVGDKVMISTSEKAKLLGVILVFLVPLILIGIAITLSLILIKSEIIALVSSLCLVVIWNIILSKIDNKIKGQKSFRSEITEIIKENKDE